MGAYNPTISLTLPLDVSLDSTLFLEVIYITAFKQGVDPLQICFQGKLRNCTLFDDGLVGEVQHNPGTTCIFHFLVILLLVSKTKSEKITTPPRNTMLIEISNHIIMILRDSALLGGLKLGEEVLDVYGVDEKLQNSDLINTSFGMKDMNSE